MLTGSLLGASLIASRFGLEQLDPVGYVLLRLSVASLAYLGFYLIDRRRHPWPTDLHLWKHAAVLGVVGTAVPLVAIISALQYQSSGITAVLVTIGPALTVLLAHFFFADEALTLHKLIGIILALSGAFLLAIRGETGLPAVSQANPLGYGLTFTAIICISAITIYMRKFMRHFDSFSVTSIQIFIATLSVMPISLLGVGLNLERVDWQGYLAVGYAGLAGTFAGYLLYFYCVKRFGATPAAMTDYVAPVVASLGGLMLLGETITPGMLIGSAIIVVGIVIINY